MGATRRIATFVGALFLLAMVASLVGGALLEGALTGPDALARLGAAPASVTLGVALELVNALAVVGIAVALFPLFRRQGDGAALGYVALRLLEAVVLVAAAFLPIALVGLSRDVAAAEPAVRPGLAALAEPLLGVRAELTGILVPLFFCLGALLLYAWIYRSRMLPRFIAVWGFVGVAGIALLNAVDVGTTGAMLLALPIILNELFLGGWLVVRGFGAGAAPSTPRTAAPAA